MKIQSVEEERWNWITHGFGMILSIIGTFWLLLFNSPESNVGRFSILIYGLSLITLYFASTSYHFAKDLVLKKKFRVLDHIGIYLLIAGTYTPVALITLIHSKGWLLFSIVWTITAIGTLLKLFLTGKYETASLIFYLIMGWLIVLDIKTLRTMVGDPGIWMLILGGVAYTVGIVFYAWKSLPYNHVIWHIFVLAGSAFHYFFILKYVL